jgi:DNA-binding NarL/FixJ family response regulator
LELLRAVARGDSNRQIARHLGITEGTVRKHLEHIYRRLGVQSRTQAVARVAPLATST